MKVTRVVITTVIIFYISCSFAGTDPCNDFNIYTKVELDDSNFMQDAVRFAADNGYATKSTLIGSYLIDHGYRDYAQYCIEHICSSAIKDLIKLNRIKPQAINKAIYDYTYILEKKFNVSCQDDISYKVKKSLSECTKFKHVGTTELTSKVNKEFKEKLKQVIFGVSTLESKMEDIVLTS